MNGAVGRGHAELELRDPHYDGDTLSGVLLVGAAEGGLCLDKRLIPGVAVSVDWVWDCTSPISNPVPFLLVDYRVPPPSPEDVLILEPGYWYGGPVRIPLFTLEQPAGKRNPDCVEVSLSFYPLAGGPAGRLRLRAQREPPALMEGGSPVWVPETK